MTRAPDGRNDRAMAERTVSRNAFMFVLVIVFIAIQPRITLAILAYSYLISPLVEAAITRSRGGPTPQRVEAPPGASL